MTLLQKPIKHEGHKGNAFHLLTVVYFVSFVWFICICRDVGAG